MGTVCESEMTGRKCIFKPGFACVLCTAISLKLLIFQYQKSALNHSPNHVRQTLQGRGGPNKYFQLYFVQRTSLFDWVIGKPRPSLKNFIYDLFFAFHFLIKSCKMMNVSYFLNKRKRKNRKVSSIEIILFF